MRLRDQLITMIQSPRSQAEFRRRGRAAVGNTSRNACGATASQPFFDLDVIHAVYPWAEGLVRALKATKLFDTSSNRADVAAGDVIVCEDMNQNGAADHVWIVVADLGGGWYQCLDNQGTRLTHRRRLDGKDGKTQMRGRLRLK